MPEVTQNGKSVKVPMFKGKVNFAHGYRVDPRRPLSTVKVGSLVVRVRANDRTLIKVLAPLTEGGLFAGQYVTSKGKPVAECAPKSFYFARWPVFAARPSH